MILFGMIDSGAMVSCCTEATMRAFSQLREAFHEEASVVRGVGEITCRVLGECRRVAVSMGSKQMRGSTYYVTFKVTEGSEYNVIFGLSTLV